MNLVVQTGRLARDVEVRYTPSNKAVAQFSIAVKKSFLKEKEKNTAYFFSVIVWGTQAENCKKYLVKGSLVNVIGELRTRNYEASDGNIRYVTEIVANRVEFLDNKHNENNVNIEENQERAQSSLYDNESVLQLTDDDLPF